MSSKTVASYTLQYQRPLKVMLFGTHPKQFNGYSKVVYELAKGLSEDARIQLSIFGFQNMSTNIQHRIDLPDNVDIYDALANENPKLQGFGIADVSSVVHLKRPDVIVVYNDLFVICSVISQLKEIPNRWFKIIAYIDQVYLSQKQEYIKFVNEHADAALAFTPSWKDCIIEQGLSVPCDILEHGIDPMINYPVPQALARKHFNLPEDDFIVLNLNRNQPRKRWDICIKAFAHCVSSLYTDDDTTTNDSVILSDDRSARPQRVLKDPSKPMLKLLIGTSLQGAWNLLEVYERELKKRNLTMTHGLKHLLFIDNPQKFTDEDINIMYNASDCGINTADGEGVGLCSVEAAVVGVPQIVPSLGGFKDFFNESCALMIEPTLAYYVDSARDPVGGEALMCDYRDFADAIMQYYADGDLRKRHGQASRERILRPHVWKQIASAFADSLMEKFGDVVGYVESSTTHEPESEESLDETMIIPMTDVLEEMPSLDKLPTISEEDLKDLKDLNEPSTDDGVLSLSEGIGGDDVSVSVSVSVPPAPSAIVQAPRDASSDAVKTKKPRGLNVKKRKTATATNRKESMDELLRLRSEIDNLIFKLK